MKFGYFGLNVGTFQTPDSIARLVVTAEQLNFESIWTGEHVVLVDPQVPPSPAPPHSTFVDTIASLAFAAAKTTRIKLGSGIILIAQREPIVLAKELAGIDVLSKGRLLVGIGVGYVKGEFDALGIPFEERGPRTSEHIEVLRTLWTSEKPEFSGRFTKFAGIQSRPFPVQKPHPPIHVGGMSAPALRRAVAQGNGWYGFFQDLAATAEDARRAARDGQADPAPGVARKARDQRDPARSDRRGYGEAVRRSRGRPGRPDARLPGHGDQQAGAERRGRRDPLPRGHGEGAPARLTGSRVCLCRSERSGDFRRSFRWLPEQARWTWDGWVVRPMGIPSAWATR